MVKTTVKKTSKPRTTLKKKPKQLGLFDVISNGTEQQRNTAIDTIKAMILLKSAPGEWRGLVATPPGSFIEKILEIFNEKTNIPLEIPFFTSLHYLSAYLLQNDVCINVKNQILKPDIWTVVLAQSGAGKTFASSTIGKYIGEEASFPDSASSAKFIENLSKHNKSFFLRDEFGQFLKNIETQPHMAEMKDILLRLYDNKKIERNTKKEEITIEDPALVILGVSVLDTFLSQIGIESLVDGFSQRFNYVIAEPDPSRKMEDFAFYDVFDEITTNTVRTEWEKLKNNIKHQEYKVSDNALGAFISSFKLLSNIQLPEAFYRRIMFKGMKYALLYHILLGKTIDIIDSEDMAWAGRLCAIHLKDSAKLLQGHDKTDIQNLIELTEKACERLKEKGEEINPRNLIRSVNRIKTVTEAKALLSIINH